MRGCDGHDKVVEVVKALNNVVPLSLMFCLSPWNSFSDMEYVINMAREYNIDVRIGIYGTMDFFDTKADLLAADLSLCQNLNVKLGNIHENSLDEIFNSRNTQQIQCRYSKECNACWINFHRKFDLILLRNLERVFPKRIIEIFYGKYQWTNNSKMTYRKQIKRIRKI